MPKFLGEILRVHGFGLGVCLQLKGHGGQLTRQIFPEVHEGHLQIGS
jgi:hypothetical protein